MCKQEAVDFMLSLHLNDLKKCWKFKFLYSIQYRVFEVGSFFVGEDTSS